MPQTGFTVPQGGAEAASSEGLVSPSMGLAPGCWKYFADLPLSLWYKQTSSGCP